MKITVSGKGKNNLRGKKKFLKFNTWENICPCDYPLPLIQEKKTRKKKEKEKEKKKAKKTKTKLKKKKKSSDSHTNVYRCREGAIIEKKQHKKIHAER